MKIIIKGADFKDNNLESTTISKYYSVTYSGAGVSSSSAPKSIAYGDDNYATQDLVATIKVLSSYTFNSVSSVSVGGTTLLTSDYTVSGQTVTVPANKVNGNVVIAVSATAVNTGGGSGDTGGDSGNADGGTLITAGSLTGSYLYLESGFTSTTDDSIKTDSLYFIYKYIPVTPGKTYRLAKGRAIFFHDASKKIVGTRGNLTSGYEDYTFTTSSSHRYISVAFKYEEINPSDVVLEDKTVQLQEKQTVYLKDTGAAYKENYGWDSVSYTEKASEGYYSYAAAPIKPSTTYKMPYARSTWFLDSAKNALYRINVTNDITDFTFTTNSNVAYVSPSYKAAEVSKDNACIIEYENA